MDCKLICILKQKFSKEKGESDIEWHPVGSAKKQNKTTQQLLLSSYNHYRTSQRASNQLLQII